MASITLSLIVVRAADMKASLAFYRTLGIDFIQEQHGSGPIHYSCDFGGLVLELYPQKSGALQSGENDTTLLGFNIASLEATLTELQKLGIQPSSQPRQSEWGRWVNVLDPDGRTVQLNQTGA